MTQSAMFTYYNVVILLTMAASLPETFCERMGVTASWLQDSVAFGQTKEAVQRVLGRCTITVPRSKSRRCILASNKRLLFCLHRRGNMLAVFCHVDSKSEHMRVRFDNQTAPSHASKRSSRLQRHHPANVVHSTSCSSSSVCHRQRDI